MSVLPPVFVELKATAQELHAKLDEADQHMAKLAKSADGHGEAIRAGLGRGFQALGGAMTGAGAVLEHVGHQQEVAAKDLEVAIKNTGGSFEEYSRKIAGTVTQQEKFGHTADDTKEAMAKLVRATGDTGKAIDDMKLVTELAAAKHISLADAAGVVAKMHAGAFKPLKDFGINLKDNASAVRELNDAQKMNEDSSNALGTAKGKLADLEERLRGKTKLSVSEQQALRDAHRKVEEATSNAAAAADYLAKKQAEGAKAMDFAGASALVLQKLHGTAAAQADTFGGKIAGLKAHLTDMAGAVGEKVGPAMVTAGPLMMGFGSIIQSSLIPTIISLGTSALAAAGEVILAVAPIAIPLALIGIAAYELYKHWDQVWGFVKSIAKGAFDWIKHHMDLIIDVALGPIGIAITLLSKHWDTIWGGMKTVVADVAGFIEAAFKAPFNAVAYLWNHTLGKMSFHLPDWVPGLGGKGFDMPTIPMLADGGIVSRPTLAMIGEAGPEAVVPLSRGGGLGGPTVHVVVQGPVIGRNGMAELSEMIRAELLRSARGRGTTGLA